MKDTHTHSFHTHTYLIFNVCVSIQIFFSKNYVQHNEKKCVWKFFEYQKSMHSYKIMLEIAKTMSKNKK